MQLSYTLQELADKVSGSIRGDADIVINAIAPIENAGLNQLTFLSNKKMRDKLFNSQAGIIVVTQADVSFCHPNSNLIIVSDPHVAYARIAQLLDNTPSPANSISNRASISTDAVIGNNVAIGDNAVIESGVVLADDVIIGAGCFIGKNTKIGARTKLWANVTVYHNCDIGSDCIIKSSAVIGGDGFGYANDKGTWIKIPQIGQVIIGNNVEIGSCTCIDRGALDNTVIANNVIIDNLCQIAHNVHVGQGTAIAGAVVLAGSLHIGQYCLIGGGSVINGHMSICDKVTITGMSMVMRPITEPGVYSSGIPAQPNKQWHKTAALTLRIDQLNQRVKELEKQMDSQK